MNLIQQTIAGLGFLLIAAALTGLAVRHRYPHWWFFDLYLLAVLIGTAIPHVAPRWWTPEVYQGKEMAYAVLRLCMALEVGLRIFRSFPGAMATARRLSLLIIGVTLAAVVLAPHGGYVDFVAEIQPRILNGSVWLFTCLAALILWYRLPIKPFHKSVVLSYVPYLLATTVLTSMVANRAWEKSDNLQYFNQLAYVALLTYWNVVIWRRDPPARAQALPANLEGVA